MSHKETSKFENLIYNILTSRSKKILIIALVFLSLVASIMMIPSEAVLVKMLPSKSADTFTIYIDTLKGSSIEETKKVSRCVTDILKKEKVVTDMELYLGEGAPLDYAGLVKGSALKKGEQFAEIVVNLTSKHEREEKSFNLVHRLRPIIQDSCEDIDKPTTVKLIEMPSGPPMLASLVVEVYGDNNEEIDTLSKQVATILDTTDGLVDIDIMANRTYNEYKLTLNNEKITKSGLSVSQINKILYLAFEGASVGVKSTQNSNTQIPIFVRLSDDSRSLDEDTLQNLEFKLGALKLMNKQGLMIPLTELVSVEESESESMIYHKDLKTMVNVTAETDMVSQVYPLLEARKIMIELFSEGYDVEEQLGLSTYMFDLKLTNKLTGEKSLVRFDGEMKVTLDTFRDLGTAFIAALVLIFIVFVIYYKSFAISGIILGGSFLSIIGVIVGHWVADIFTIETFFLTATSLIGFIALMGISSRNSLLMVDFAQGLIKEGVEKRKAVAQASATRAKPIMLTAIAIILGSALLTSDPVFGGLGVALISGTIAAVIVSLFFIPVLLDNSKSI
ncbi:MAG: efflux RND transporter permease subunit [Sulfurimonas sp.]